MQIRRLTHEDFLLCRSQIEALFNSSVRINFPDCDMGDYYGRDKCNKVLSFLKDGTAIVFAACEGSELKGWIWCHEIVRMNQKRLHIAEIAVTDDSQRKGVGSKLLNEAEAYAKRNGYNEIDLFVTVSNINAVKFYENSLFEPERLLMKKTIR